MNFPGIDVLMTYNPCMVTADTSPATARNLMDQYSLRHLPVVDSERQLIGIVSDVDLAPLSRPQMAMASVGTSHSTGPSQQDQTHVEEIMTESVVVITPADSPGHAVRMMLKHDIHSLPIVERERLVGVITSSDYLREFTHGTVPGYRDPAGKHALRWFAQADSTATIHEAGRIMEGTGQSYLAVMQGELPIGIVSRRVLDVARGSDVSDVGSFDAHRPIDPWVNTDVPTLRQDATLGRAADAMLQHRAPAVVIVDRSHALVGLLPQDAILQVVAEHLA
ncbi:MAG: CBS domain-containing protein [Planctomycetes bacterium]|nr:CBS domain-containing protein [Planctomycetota bacterium]